MSRLQFRHHIEVFKSREEAISFLDGLVNNETGNAPIRESKMGEPLLVTYLDENSKKHAILAIGKNEGGTGVPYQYIDADFMLSKIEANEKSIEEVQTGIDEINTKVDDAIDRITTVEKGMIKEIIINDLPADIQDNIARLIIGAKDIKLTDYTKATDPKDALHDTDSINTALGKLESKSDNNDERLKELEKIQPDEITIIKTSKDKNNVFLSTNLSIKKIESTQSANSDVRDIYRLVDGKGNQLGSDITVFKESHLKNVELKKDEHGNASILEFTYVGIHGEDLVIDIDVANFLQEAEFKTGLEVNNGEVSVKRDPSSEDFFVISNDGLKVTGVSDAIANAVKAETDRATNAEGSLETKIAEETKRASNSELALDNKIDKEITRATTKESELNTKIDKEITRATNAEGSLETKIAEEVKRASDSESALDDKIDKEITRATTKESELNTKIDKEITRATNAEGSLETKITTEVGRIDEKIKTERESIDSSIKAVSETLDKKIDTTTSSTLAAANKYTDDESAKLKELITEEQTRATAAENSIKGTMTSEDNRIYQEATGYTHNEVVKLSTAINSVNSDLTTEITRAQKEETALKNSIDQLTTDTANNIDKAVSKANTYTDTKISEVNSALSTEIDRAKTKENELNNSITGEATRAKEMEKAIAKTVSDEATRAKNKESEIEKTIASEDKRIYSEATGYTHTQIDLVNASIKAETDRATAEEGKLSNAITGLATETETKLKNTLKDAKDYTNQEITKLSDVVSQNKVIGVAPITTTTVENGTEVGITLESNRILSQINGALSTTLNLVYDADNWLIKLLGVNDAVITTLDAKSFVKSGLINSISVIERNGTKYLVITYQDVEGTNHNVEIALTELFSPYVASNGIEIKTENKTTNLISAKINPEGDGSYLTLTSAGIGLNGITTAINNVKTELNGKITSLENKTTSLESRMSGDATVDGSVANKIAVAKDDIKGDLISKTVTNITTESASEQTLLRKIGIGSDAELYVSSNSADMFYKSQSLEKTIDDIKSTLDDLSDKLSKLIEKVNENETKLNSINIIGTEQEIKVTKDNQTYKIGFSDDAIFGPVTSRF